jgi:hypothetical protein
MLPTSHTPGISVNSPSLDDKYLEPEVLPEEHEVIQELIREAGVEFGCIGESESGPGGDDDEER